jgi:hypothetical protein
MSDSLQLAQVEGLVNEILKLDHELKELFVTDGLLFAEREERALDIHCDLSDLAIDLALILSDDEAGS